MLFKELFKKLRWLCLLVVAVMAVSYNTLAVYGYAQQEARAVREAEAAAARTSVVRQLTCDTVYMRIPNISRTTRQFVYDKRDYISQYCNLVLDLRGNYGGWLSDFHRIACLFVPRGAVIAREEMRLPIFTRYITSDRDVFFVFENIIILQDRRTASAAEGLILALQEHVRGVVTLGDTTFGKGIGQVTVPITGGYAVRATVLNMLGPQGQSVHMVGIEPDVKACGETDKVTQALSLIYKCC